MVIRTLDAGSDKPIAFATLPGEENPALGVRGLRLSFGNPGLMDRQLDGIRIAAERTGTETWVMAPMVATVAEAADFAEKVRARGLKPGIMVEIPSAALLAHRMLEVVDFLSIGTNDLTQYAMAADRMATDLAHLTDPWQPAVLQLIAITAEAGKQAGKSVGVCGEAAADPLLACALVGMGVTSLSMAARAVRPVGAQLSRVSMDTCEAAAEAALGAERPDGRARRRTRAAALSRAGARHPPDATNPAGAAPVSACSCRVALHDGRGSNGSLVPPRAACEDASSSSRDACRARYGSTVTLMASPLATMSNADITSSRGMCRVMRSLTGTWPVEMYSSARLLWSGEEPLAPWMCSWR